MQSKAMNNELLHRMVMWVAEAHDLVLSPRHPKLAKAEVGRNPNTKHLTQD